MKYKASWFLIIFLPTILFFLFSYKAFQEICFYLSLNEQKQGNILKYEIRNDKRDKYKALIHYSFKFKDKNFENKSFCREFFLNYINAKDYVEKLSKNNFTIWFNLKNPNISSFEKNFPVKNCVYVFITFLIFFYFLILKVYVYNFRKND